MERAGALALAVGRVEAEGTKSHAGGEVEAGRKIAGMTERRFMMVQCFCGQLVWHSRRCEMAGMGRVTVQVLRRCQLDCKSGGADEECAASSARCRRVRARPRPALPHRWGAVWGRP